MKVPIAGRAAIPQAAAKPAEALFVRKRFDRIEARGAPCREISEYHADRAGKGE